MLSAYKAKDSVLGLELDVDAVGNEVGGHGWHADAKVDVHAILELQSAATGNELWSVVS